MNSKDVSLVNDYAKARDLRNELRRLEESIARRARPESGHDRGRAPHARHASTL